MSDLAGLGKSAAPIGSSRTLQFEMTGNPLKFIPLVLGSIYRIATLARWLFMFQIYLILPIVDYQVLQEKLLFRYMNCSV